MSQQTESADMGGAEYASLEDVAAERGEEPAKLARQLVRRGCDLWLWFDDSKEYRSGECESKHGSGWGYPSECILPGHYRLAPEASTEAIRRIAVDDFSVAGLVLVFEFAPDDTLSIRMAEDDATVYVVVNPADLSQLPPPPSEDMGASGSGHPTPRGEKISENFEPGKNKPHTAFAAHEVTAGTKRGDVWKKLKRLASESRGEQQVELPGYGLIYLKRDRHDPENAVMYKHHKFDCPDDGELVQKSAFDTAWTTEKKGRMKET